MADREETVLIESVGGSGPVLNVDRATMYEITTDITSPSEARIEMGDNSTWKSFQTAIAIGRRFRVSLNGRSLISGRLLMRAMPLSASAGATVQLTIRTLVADAAFTSCEPVNVRKATLKSIVLQAYASVGATEKDFQFNADLARDAITGRSKVTGPPVDLSTITEQDARVQPPETVFSFVDRHLRRFNLMHWDGPDGKIIVGKPNDFQSASYLLQCLRNTPRGNNLIDIRRTEDYEQVPGELFVYGQGGGRDYTRTKIKASATNPTLLAAVPVLRRRTFIIDESVTTQALAQARAKREMAMRSLQRDSWDVSVAGWCHRYSSRLVPYAIDTVADLCVDTVSPVAAPYYLWRVTYSGDASNGHSARITLAAKGVWSV
jgi:hypothetical protein